MLLNLLVASPFTLVATVFAVCLAHALLNRGHWRRAWQELCTTDWWSLSLGLLMPAAAAESGWTCEACGAPAHLRCSRCMAVRYCCLDCQRRHWRAGHKSECGTQRVKLSPEELEARRAELDAKLPEPFPAAERLLYSYDKFLQFFQHPKLFLPSEIAGSPVGFFNVGNTCYANAVLQCLFATPSFSAFLHEFGRWKSYHKSEGAGEDPFTQGATWSLLSEVLEPPLLALPPRFAPCLPEWLPLPLTALHLGHLFVLPRLSFPPAPASDFCSPSRLSIPPPPPGDCNLSFLFSLPSFAPAISTPPHLSSLP